MISVERRIKFRILLIIVVFRDGVENDLGVRQRPFGTGMGDVRLPAAVGDEAFKVGGDENARLWLRRLRFGGRISRAVAVSA